MQNLKLSFIMLLSVFLFGCASGAKVENMVYTPIQGQTFDEALKNEINVTKVSGGEKTNPLWTSEISSEAFSTSVKNSLSAHGLLAEGGQYKLKITLLLVDQPMFGLDMEVITHVRYVLTDSSNESVIFDDTIVAPYTATVGDAFVAIERLRLANEGSGKKNIEELINKLSELKIEPQQVSINQ